MSPQPARAQRKLRGARIPKLPEASILLLESSFAALAPRGDELVSRFYARLFAEHPEVRSMFPAEMVDQEKKLLGALALVVKSARKLDTIAPMLVKLGRKHSEFGAAPRTSALPTCFTSL